MTKISFYTVALFNLTCWPAMAQQAGPNVAVFDPQANSHTRFRMDVGEMNATAETLRSAGLNVTRVTQEQIDDPAVFNAQKFDVFVLNGESVPRANFPELTKFAQSGGVFVAIASKNPFNKAVEKAGANGWQGSPNTPMFAWQTGEISELFGIQYTYRQTLSDTGLSHTATPLLRKYLPAAKDYEGVVSSSWIYPANGGEFIPLLRSRRADGQDASPQLYIARKGSNRAIISANDLWTQGGEGWEMGKETMIALVKMAYDLRRGTLSLDGNERSQLTADMPAPEPMTTRLVKGEVDPDDAPVVTRWGKFDGSGLDLSDTTTLPRALKAKASIVLPVRQNGKPLYLRVRGAFAQNGVGLKVEVGQQTLWNENFVYANVGDVGNYGSLNLGGSPIEFTRRVFVPPTQAESVTLTNLGTQPLYFDAVQLENDPVKPMMRLGGMGAGMNQRTLKGTFNLPGEYVREWTGMRGPLWSHDIGAPGDPNRWNNIDARIKNYAINGAPVELDLQGTAEWAAITPERYAAAPYKRATPPDPEKYREIVEHVVKNSNGRISMYEIWNEQDSKHFWLGDANEYVKLWRTVVPIIRRGDPKSQVIVGGLTGFDQRFLDVLVRDNVLKEADMLAFHPYAGNEAAWDKPFGRIQGQLYSLGQNIEIYNNEVAFPNRNTDGFTDAKFPYSPKTQERMTNVALARLMANSIAKFTIFYGGGDDSSFAHIDSKGQPLPAYLVLQDYFKLSQNGGQRLDISMSRSDGQPLRGVYAASALHKDGSATVVLNPSEVILPVFDAPDDAPAPDLSVPLTVRVPLVNAGKWKAALDGQPVSVKVNTLNGQGWADIELILKKRSLLTITPTL